MPWWDRIEASPLGYRFARGAFWNLLGATTFRGLSLIASIVVARILGKHSFGEFGILQSTFGMFGVFAGFGLGLTSTKYVAELRQGDPARAGRILTLSACTAWATGGLTAAALAMLAPWLATHTLAAPHLAPDLAVGALLVLLGAVNGTQMGALSGFEAFKRTAQVSFWGGVANFPCLAAGCYFFGVPGAIWGLVAAQSIACVLNRWAIGLEARRFGIGLWAPGWQREIPILWRFSLPSLIGSGLYVPASWICATLLVNQTNGYAEMGVFSAATQVYGVLLFLPSILGNVALPLMSADRSLAQRESHRTLSFALKANLLLAAVPALLFLPLSPWLASLFGKGFGESSAAFAAALLTAVPIASFSPYQRFLSARGLAWTACGTNFVHAAVFVCLSLNLVHQGAVGLIWARFWAHMTDGVYSFLAATLYKRRQSRSTMVAFSGSYKSAQVGASNPYNRR